MPFDLPDFSAGNNRYEMLRSDYGKAFFGAGLIILVIVLYVFEIRHFNNTLGVKGLVISGLVVGALLGLLLASQLQKYADELIEQFQIYITAMLLTMALMPLLVSMTNRLLSFHPIEKERVEFVQSDPFISSRFGHLPEQEIEGYHTFVIYRNRLERLKSKTVLFPNASKGDQVDLTLRKGLWGFRFFVFDRDGRTF